MKGGYNHRVIEDHYSNKDYKIPSFEDEDELVDLLNELENEKEAWKDNSCSYLSTFSILSMDCQIVQEAIWDLGRYLRYNYRCPLNDETDLLLKDLEKKFTDLNNHRLGKFK